MSDFIKDFGNYVSEKYVQDKGAETPVTESKSFGGSGVSFEVIDGAIVTTYDSPSLAAKAHFLSEMHLKKKAAYATQNDASIRR